MGKQIKFIDKNGKIWNATKIFIYADGCTVTIIQHKNEVAKITGIPERFFEKCNIK